MMAPCREPPITEPFLVPETPADGIAGIIACGETLRISLYTERPALGGTPHERIIVAHFRMDRNVALQMAEAIAAACSRHRH